MIQPMNWKVVVRFDLHHNDKKMQQSAAVYLGEDGIYYAAVLDNIWERVGIVPATDIKDAVYKAYELTELFLARRVKEDDEEAKRNRELKVKK